MTSSNAPSLKPFAGMKVNFAFGNFRTPLCDPMCCTAPTNTARTNRSTPSFNTPGMSTMRDRKPAFPGSANHASNATSSSKKRADAGMAVPSRNNLAASKARPAPPAPSAADKAKPRESSCSATRRAVDFAKTSPAMAKLRPSRHDGPGAMSYASTTCSPTTVAEIPPRASCAAAGAGPAAGVKSARRMASPSWSPCLCACAECLRVDTNTSAASLRAATHGPGCAEGERTATTCALSASNKFLQTKSQNTRDCAQGHNSTNPSALGSAGTPEPAGSSESPESCSSANSACINSNAEGSRSLRGAR